jgi:cytochrome c
MQPVGRLARNMRNQSPMAARLFWSAIGVALTVTIGCGSGTREAAASLVGGNPDRGEEAIRRYGCGSCHTIPGIRSARGMVGPPLAGIAARAYIGGVLTNSPEHMIQWIRNAHAVDAKTAMPNLGVTETDARNIASYLYTLR